MALMELLIGLITAGILAVGLFLTLKSISTSRLTAKQLATMDFIQSFWEVQKTLMKRYANGDADPKEHSRDRLSILVDLERLAVGWRVGIYDWEIIKRCMGSGLIEAYEILKDPIEDFRRRPGGTDDFKEIERLVEQMRKDPPIY